MPTEQVKLRIGVAGIGRMGKRHASNVAYYAPRAQLVAISDPDTSTHEWAKKELPSDIEIFSSTEDMLNMDGIDAILIATSTAQHAELCLSAIAKGKHVFTEKPISISLEKSAPVVEAAAAHPELTVMIGFSRRYDDSYRDVAEKIQQGLLGEPYYIRSATNDMRDTTGFFVNYSAASGGIFLDMAIHDIDISRWLLDVANPAKLKNPKKQVTSVYATGVNVHHPELSKTGDCDNGFAFIEYENGTKLIFHVSRSAHNGHDAPCEVFGSKAKMTVNWGSNMNKNEIRDAHGVRTESHANYYDRFQGGFVKEVSVFAECALDKKPVPTTLEDGYAAAEIAAACTHAFRTGKTVFFDDEGKPIMN